MLTILLMPSVTLLPGSRYGVKVILVLANVCMPCVRLLCDRVIRLDEFFFASFTTTSRWKGSLGLVPPS